MNKHAFMTELRAALAGLPAADVEERLNFYAEMIDDRIEEGMTEEEAVADIGSVELIASRILEDIPLANIVRDSVKPKRKLQVWEILLLILGSPIWGSLLIAAVAVIFSLYASLWAVIISLWGAAFGSLAAVAVCGVAVGVGFAVTGNLFQGMALFGAGLVCAGLSIFMFFGCREATKGTVWLTKKIALGIKNLFIKKEAAL